MGRGLAVLKELFSALTRWLENPTIRITPSDELVRLREENQRLTKEAQRLTDELHRVERLYYDECTVNMRLVNENDALKERIEEEERQRAQEAIAQFRRQSDG